MPCQQLCVAMQLVTGDLPIKGAMRDVTVPDECPASIRALIVDCMSGQAADRPSDTEVRHACRPPVKQNCSSAACSSWCCQIGSNKPVHVSFG